MSDTSFATYIHYGTNAQRLAFTPSPGGGQPVYFWYETDTGSSYVYDTSWHLLTSSAGDVVGPAGAVADRIAIYNGVTGKIIKDGGSTIAGVIASAVAASAPIGADYVVETADGSLTNESVLGTVVITTTTYASKQAAAKEGRLFLANNGFYLERDTGAAWSPWGPLFPMTQPIDGDFAWINQGGASVDATNGGIYLLAPVSASFSMRVRKKAAPATPYTITAAFIPTLMNLNYQGCGLLFRESGSGKIVTFGTNTQSTGLPYIYVSKFNSATSFSADYVTRNYDRLMPVFFRIADDGTNRICSYSGDGQHWIVFHSVGRTNFLTADEVGFYVNDETNTYPAGMTLLSWKQA